MTERDTQKIHKAFTELIERAYIWPREQFAAPQRSDSQCRRDSAWISGVS